MDSCQELNVEPAVQTEVSKLLDQVQQLLVGICLIQVCMCEVCVYVCVYAGVYVHMCVCVSLQYATKEVNVASVTVCRT
jgi:hypothetical protein